MLSGNGAEFIVPFSQNLMGSDGDKFSCHKFRKWHVNNNQQCWLLAISIEACYDATNLSISITYHNHPKNFWFPHSATPETIFKTIDSISKCQKHGIHFLIKKQIDFGYLSRILKVEWINKIKMQGIYSWQAGHY